MHKHLHAPEINKGTLLVILQRAMCNERMTCATICCNECLYDSSNINEFKVWLKECHDSGTLPFELE